MVTAKELGRPEGREDNIEIFCLQKQVLEVEE
jgi:hypothetical protein